MSTIFDQETDTKTQKPKQYLVHLMNDDFTSFDVVHTILMACFRKNMDEAEQLAYDIHKNGSGIAGGPYTLEIAEDKQLRAMDFAKRHEMPLNVKITEA